MMTHCSCPRRQLCNFRRVVLLLALSLGFPQACGPANNEATAVPAVASGSAQSAQPGASDPPGETGAVAAAASSTASQGGVVSGRSAGQGGARNVILVSIDTLRVDRLEAYGYRRPTSPNLAALAARSVLFEQAQAQAPQTAPSHASVFTSQYAGTHGIYNVHGNQTTYPTLPTGLVTLAGLLEKSGVETAAFVCSGNLTKKMKLDRGFESWDERNEDVALRVDAALDWLKKPRQKPFFLLLHTYQVHAPYVPPAGLVPQFTDPSYAGPLRERLERYLKLPTDKAWEGGVGADYWDGMLEYSDADVKFLSDLYDAEIAHVDAELRRLLEAVLVGPLAADTAIIVFADHGEEFRDHGKFQHDQTFEELVHVPLMIHLPVALERKEWKGRVRSGVQLIDVAPTIADLFGVAWRDAGWKGRSLLPLLDPATRGVESAKNGPRYSELTIAGPKVYACVTANGWKYTHIHQQDLDKTWESLFDLSADPGEKRNLLDEQGSGVPMTLRKLKDLLREQRAKNAEAAKAAGHAGSAPMDDESRQGLEALGYIDGSAGDGGSAADPAPQSAGEPAETPPKHEDQGAGAPQGPDHGPDGSHMSEQKRPGF